MLIRSRLGHSAALDQQTLRPVRPGRGLAPGRYGALGGRLLPLRRA